MVGRLMEKEYEIHYYEVDFKRRAFITTLINYLQDIAIWQSEELGVGIDYLKENKLGWVLYKWDVKINKYPLFGEKVKVSTRPYSFKKFYAYRKFEVFNSENELLLSANSMWFLINLEKRRPIRVLDTFYNAYGIDTDSDEPLEMEDIKAPSEVTSEREFIVRYSDIDTNRHVNNEKYLAWIIETIPQEIVLNYTLQNLKVVYEKETTYGEIIKVITEIIEEVNKITGIHKIVDKEGKEITLSKTEWFKN